MQKTLDQMFTQMQGLLDQSRAHTTVENSIAEQAKSNGVILQSLRQQLASAATDPDKLQKLGDLMDSMAAAQMSEEYAQAAVKAALANTSADPNKPADGTTGTTDQTGGSGTATTDISGSASTDAGSTATAGTSSGSAGSAAQPDPNAATQTQAPQPPIQPATDIPEGSRQTGPTGEMFEVKAGQWVLVQA